MSDAALETAALEAIALLRALPRDVNAKRKARDAFETYRARHSAVDPLLVIDHPPAARELDFDVLLKDPSGASLALALRPDGNPWAAHYADHWDAPWVVGAKDTFLSIQWAITSFFWMARSDPGLKARLEEDVLVCHWMENHRYEVPLEVLQQAVDDFRHVHGLEDEADMRAWLTEMGMSEERFFNLVQSSVEANKVRDDVTAGKIEPYFAAHRTHFDRTVMARAECPDAATAERVAAFARETGFGAASAASVAGLGVRSFTVTPGFARGAPASLRDAATGAVHVEAHPRRPVVWQVVARTAATWDEATQLEARDAVFEAWVTSERARVGVRWFGT